MHSSSLPRTILLQDVLRIFLISFPDQMMSTMVIYVKWVPIQHRMYALMNVPTPPTAAHHFVQFQIPTSYRVTSVSRYEYPDLCCISLCRTVSIIYYSVSVPQKISSCKIFQQVTKNNPKKVHAAPPMDISIRIVNAKQMCHFVNQHATEICIVKDMQRGIMGNAIQRLHLNVQVLKVVGNTIRGTLAPWTWILDVDQEGGEIDIMDAISKKEVIFQQTSDKDIQ